MSIIFVAYRKDHQAKEIIMLKKGIADMEKTVYLANPCKASNLPFWKLNLIQIPENMKVVLEDEL